MITQCCFFFGEFANLITSGWERRGEAKRLIRALRSFCFREKKIIKN